jgi:hypothetical protein
MICEITKGSFYMTYGWSGEAYFHKALAKSGGVKAGII